MRYVLLRALEQARADLALAGRFGQHESLNPIHQPAPSNPLATQFFAAVSASHCATALFGRAEQFGEKVD